MALAVKDGKLVVKNGKLCSSCCDTEDALGACCFRVPDTDTYSCDYITAKECAEREDSRHFPGEVCYDADSQPDGIDCSDPDNHPDPDPNPEPDPDATGMCCYLDDSGDVCANTTRQGCDDLQGRFFEGYNSAACSEGGYDSLCGMSSPCADGLGTCGNQCVEWTVSIAASNYIDGIGDERVPFFFAGSYETGSPTNKPYPTSLNPSLDPPWGPTIPGFTPNTEINWLTKQITLRPGEIGFLIANISVSQLLSLNSHANALFAAGAVPDPMPETASSPAFSGGIDINVTVAIPIYVAGCDASTINLGVDIAGYGPPLFAELPGNVDRLVAAPSAGGGSYTVSQDKVFEVGRPRFTSMGRPLTQIALPPCDCNGTCETTQRVAMSFGGGQAAVKWWPSGTPRTQDNFYLGTEWAVQTLETWKVTLTQNVVDCGTPNRSNPLP